MESALTAKEQLGADTPLFLFDCTLADGTAQHWSSRTDTLEMALRLRGRALFVRICSEAQLASDTQVRLVLRS